ncbi:MAG: flagellin [Deltaproteobacteria bacterium]|nr:flagellin [Deltaproteobacteria bacterium]MBW2085174.1 flagellin [Deltaproteobacteria bacterium]
MGLVINHNMMAMTAARHLQSIYGSLGKSIERLSSGLRVNSAADDAAGLAIRELMRADIRVTRQGIRNASDGISLLQTAEGALSVIDEKLVRMKELAEQAATGTYTTVQREIMNSEYQAMAAEIDRIANATDFNGVTMLNGDMRDGLKIHFGTGNSSAEDYYFIRIDDVRATPSTGLGVGTTETTNVDAWYNDNVYLGAANCAISTTNGYLFFAYDYDASRTAGSAVSTELGNIVGMYQVASAATESGAFGLNALVDAINEGTAARVGINIASPGPDGLGAALGLANSGDNVHLTVGDVKIAFYGSAAAAGGGAQYVDSDTDIAILASGTAAANFASILTSAINAANGNVFAVWNNDTSGIAVMVFAKQAGEAGNGYQAEEAIAGTSLKMQFSGASIDSTTSATTGTFSGGGESWVTASVTTDEDGRYRLRLDGTMTGAGHDIMFYEAADATDYNGGGICGASTWIGALSGYDDSATSEWIQLTDSSGVSAFLTEPGRTILTQSAAQLALGALKTAIDSKDTIRATLGAFQNRLENTITQLSIQAENLQAAESRISDVDMAWEMMEFTKNQIMVQAATAMLAQANTISQVALTLLS